MDRAVSWIRIVWKDHRFTHVHPGITSGTAPTHPIGESGTGGEAESGDDGRNQGCVADGLWGARNLHRVAELR
jgi:hypothetical protein